LIGALLVAFVAAVVVALMVRGEPVKTDRNEDLVAEQSEGPWPTRVLAAFDELFQHVGAWMILGVVAAALLEVALPKDAFAELDSTLLQFVVITLVAIPSYVCAPSATPLAAVLLAKGISPGAVLVGLLLGPATNVATIVFLRRWFGTWAAAVGVGAAVVVSWTFGFILDHFGVLNVPASALVHQHEHGVVWEWLALISGLLLVRAVYRTGARGFMATIAGEHGHEHGTGEHLHDVVGGHGHGDHEHGGHEHGGHGHGGHGHGAHDHDGHGHGGHGHGGHGHGQ
jgi:hypothetical protein